MANANDLTFQSGFQASSRSVEAAKPVSNAATGRQHYWDVVRGLLMLLGIPYHAGLIYTLDSERAVSSPSTSGLITFFTQAVHVVRMPAFYIVAAYFAAMLLERRDPMTWLKGRVIKLGIPLVACMVLINPFQAFIGESARHTADEGLRLTVYDALDSLKRPGLIWVRHAWFLIALLYYCAALTAICAVFPKVRNWRVKKLSRLHANLVATLLGASLVIGAYEVLSTGLLMELGLNKGLARTIFTLPHAVLYAPYFAIGFLIRRDDQLLASFTKRSSQLAVASILLLTMCIVSMHRVPLSIQLAIDPFAALFAAQTIVSSAKHWFDKDMVFVRKLVDASFVIYLFHMPIVEMLGILFLHIDMPPLIEWSAISCLALAVSYAVYLFVVSQPVLNALFNGVLPKQHAVTIRK